MYFLFYSFVYISTSSEEVLILNIETGDYIVSNNRNLVMLCRTIVGPTLYYMINISNDSQKDIEFMQMLSDMENRFFGCMININCLDDLPIQISPHLRIRNNKPLVLDTTISLITESESGHYKQYSYVELENNVLNHILEISLYCNTLDQNMYSKFQYYHLQNLFPLVTISQQTLNKYSFLSHVQEYNKLNNLNFILGDGNIETINNITNEINTLPSHIQLSLYCLYDVFTSLKEKFIDLFDMVYVWYYDRSSCFVKRHDKQINLYIITNMDDYRMLINNQSIDKFFPMFDGENYSFFQEYLHYDRFEVLRENITENSILMNQYVNSNFFGEISIFPDGNVFSRKGTKSLGYIDRNHMKQLLIEELTNRKNWFLTRQQMDKCNDCVLNCICPPVSSCELLLKKWTFCNL